jgi:outer membrane protein OmpA-like peptidoglycan-associated protein
MTSRAGFVAGTALALLMAGGHAFATPAATTLAPAAPQAKDVPFVLAQAATEEEDEERPRERRAEPEEAPAEEPQEMPDAGEAPTPQQAPAERPAEAPEQPAPPAANDNDDAAPAPSERPGNASPPAAEEEAPSAPSRDDGQRAAPPADDDATDGEAAPTPRERPAAERPDRASPPAESEQRRDRRERRDDEQRAAPPADEGEAESRRDRRDRDRPAAEDEAAPTPGERPSRDRARPPADEDTQAEPRRDRRDRDRDRERPADEDEAAPTPGERPADAPPPRADDDDRRGPRDDARPRDDDAAGSGRDAPILDSAKEAEDAAPEGEARQPQPEEPAGPPPTTDAEAQQLEAPVEVQSLRGEEGRRIERRQERRERREGADVLREIGDRLVIQLGGNPVVQSDDRRRLEHDASDVYYEELPRGRTRETVVRPNGVQVVTIRDRYGDVVRRSRVMPDGREHVLVYAGDGPDREERRGWRDPGLDLPPLRLGIPAEEYILDARRADDERAYYEFLDQPPVEPVRRLYSVDEVRYSARVRDSVRRIDLDTITFDFGSAAIAEDAIPRLETLAEAIGRLLDENPAETFLIEGHTDAVGSDLANLALSDRRAEAVAAALSDVFGLPPENLVTQGYGERYLKVNTQEPEQENRRVAVRRITPLVAPVASSE